MRNTLLTSSIAFKLINRDPVRLSLAVFLAGLETTLRTAAVMDLIMIIQDSGISVDHISIQVKTITHFQNISDRVVNKHKHYGSVSQMFYS